MLAYSGVTPWMRGVVFWKEVLLHPWFSHYEEKVKQDISVARSAFENMKRFKRNKKFEHATIGFIINQLVSKEDRADLLKQFLAWDKNKDGVLNKQEIIESYRNVYGTIDPDIVENIMLDIVRDDNPMIKLIDWGGARYFSRNKKMTTIKGTPYYIAPEVIREVYDEKCDIWSLGVIFYVLLCGYPPFNGDTDVEIMQNVQKGKFIFPEEEWGVISKDAKDLISKMLTYEPSKRISAKQVLLHPWFSHYEEKIKQDKNVARSAFENMKRFKRNKKFEHATIGFIINQLVSKEDRADLLKQFPGSCFPGNR